MEVFTAGMGVAAHMGALVPTGGSCARHRDAIVTKLAPKVVRGCGTILCAGWTPLMMLLTYPEFSPHQPVFSAVRMAADAGAQPAGGVPARSAAGARDFGQWTAEAALRTSNRKRRWCAVRGAGRLCWYLAPKIPPGGARTVMGYVNDDVVIVDSWLATGQWTPVVNSALVCPPTGPTAKAPTKPKPTTKPRRTVKPKPTPVSQ